MIANPFDALPHAFVGSTRPWLYCLDQIIAVRSTDNSARGSNNLHITRKYSC